MDAPANEDLQNDEERRLAKYAQEVIEPHFDVDYYLSQIQDTARPAPSSAVEHYLNIGWKLNLDPSAAFSTSYYLDRYSDIRLSGMNPFFHYVGWGRFEGRDPKDPRPLLAPQESPARTPELSSQHNALLREHFDANFYLASSPDLTGAPIDLFDHFMNYGWREHRDPNSKFSTAYYLESNPDIASSGLNPFYHFHFFGKREGRRPQSFAARLAAQHYSPLVSVIVPNFNHAKYLSTRLDSILHQSYQNFELIILDDASSDDSVSVIEGYATRHPEKIRFLRNSKNSGSVFHQWKKGIEAARGALLWICESDDFCDQDFLTHCLPPLADPSVMISFGQVQFADVDGNLVDGLDSYRENAEPGLWSQPLTRCASEWFRGSFAVSNLIPNVGGCVIRNQPIPDEIWNTATTYKILGDWFLYCHLAGGGRIAYAPSATAYFRQHGRNTSVSSFLRPHYYVEHERIITYLRERWGTPDDVCARFYMQLYRQFSYVKGAPVLGTLHSLYSNDRVLNTTRKQAHILVCLLGFRLGGGEIFPIHLANEFARRGLIVSILQLDDNEDEEKVRGMLDRRVAIYDAQYVFEYGLDRFLSHAGVDVIHSHNVGIEFNFLQKFSLKTRIPYLVTLHGSYEVTPIPDSLLLSMLRQISHWVYLTKQNLAHLQSIPIDPARLQRIPNGMPLDDRAFPFSRDDLGIGPTDVVFVIASRAIPEKGWRVAIEALLIAQASSDVRLHLLLCGTGPDKDALEGEYAEHPEVHFAGFQDAISGAYRLGDVALLPTRFGGESFPLTLIQALQVGRPVIATDVGEIGNMLRHDDGVAGELLSFDTDDSAFKANVAAAMVRMVDSEHRRRAGESALLLGKRFGIDMVGAEYLRLLSKYEPRVAASAFGLDTPQHA